MVREIPSGFGRRFDPSPGRFGLDPPVGGLVSLNRVLGGRGRLFEGRLVDAVGVSPIIDGGGKGPALNIGGTRTSSCSLAAGRETGGRLSLGGGVNRSFEPRRGGFVLSLLSWRFVVCLPLAGPELV